MSSQNATITSSQPLPTAHQFILPVVSMIALAHFFNDMMQSVITASYPMLKAEFSLSFGQIGWIALVYQLTASLIQPWIGLHTDKHEHPWLLPIGMFSTFIGLGLLAISGHYWMVLVAAGVVGLGSSIFHPEASRVARMGAGGRYGTAQSLFQVGGNAGSAIGPLLAAALIVPRGHTAFGWCMLIAAIAIGVLVWITRWRIHRAPISAKKGNGESSGLPGRRVLQAIAVIAILIFAKFIYIASISNYFTFYLIDTFHFSVQLAQVYLFVFLGAVAVGTFAGGPIGDRLGRKAVIWCSFLGAMPFALMMPYANATWTLVLVILVGLIISSAFSAMVVYAQEAVPGRVGLIAGVMFGFMFGMGGVGAAGLGHLADLYGIAWVYKVCAFLPMLGLATLFLPSLKSNE